MNLYHRQFVNSLKEIMMNYNYTYMNYGFGQGIQKKKTYKRKEYMVST